MLSYWLLLLLSCSFLGTTVYINASVTPANLLTARNTTRPGCQRKCGDLTVPYPFGIGPTCSLDNWFSIVCNDSYNPPRAFSMIGLGFSENPDIMQITESQVMIRNTQIASRCYGSQGNVISETEASFDIYASPFTYSSSGNKLTVVGCDDYALIFESAGTLTNGSNQYNYRAGCLGLCANPNEVINASCSGLGCCQTSIPLGLQSFTLNLSSLQNPSIGGVAAVQPCGYAFLAGNDSFSFGGTSDLRTGEVAKRVREHIPLVLDWSVGILSNRTILSCNTANKDATYFCQSNTHCVDSDVGGYNCNCLPGYEGNPYLQPGCTDVDECAVGEDSPCTMICVNVPGSYNCSCPTGYFGDGLKSGTGCIKIVTTSSLKKITLGLSISLGSILLLLIGWWLYSIIRRRKIIWQKSKNFERNGGLLLHQQMSSDGSVVERMKVFTADELDRATDHFHVDRVLGQGGQGTVYKGMLSEGRIVAIKKSKLVDESQSGEFINEVVILSQINHRNIMKLLGCCLETEVPLLVYEFIPNGTLFQHIHYPSEDFVITWKMRLQIASDSAGALAYLHSSTSIPIFHRDIKSSNILLDDKYRAKLSDFGTSRSVNLDQTHVTTRVMGTFGYLDPEYFQSSQYTEKSDVYSFGVVLVELLTGQKAIRSAFEEDRSLASWFLSHMENSSLLDIIDSLVLHEGLKEEFFAVANIAKLCLNLDGKKRPTMKEVLMEIEAIRSRHIPQVDEQSWPESKQVKARRTNTRYHNDITSSSSFYMENSTLSSAEVSLLFNPR